MSRADAGGPRPSRQRHVEPPSLSRRLLEWAGRRLHTPELARDADELFIERARRDGGRAARRWYRRQARASLRRLLLPGRDAGRRRPLAGRLAGFALDAKLGGRMLVRYPGLTVVCGLAMAFAIAAGAGTLELVTDIVHPTVPLPDGERIVGIGYWDRVRNAQEPPLAGDLLTWRDALTTVEDLGGFRSLRRNLTVDEGAGDAAEGVGEPVEAAWISAAGFRVARVRPLLGRGLVEADEAPGAPRVVVLGHRTWLTRFGGDPSVLDRRVRLGDAPATVVGVMPEGFAFPVRHDVWVPLTAAELRQERGEGRSLRVFGRLAPGTTLQEARAELATVTMQLAADSPERYEHLRPEVLPYAESLLGNFSAADVTMRTVIYSINLFPALFLVLVCGNVGLLMFARAATRERELLVRSALGASRGRIVSQLFVEALVLGALAVALGLPVARLALRWALDAIYGLSGPFWVDDSLSPTTVVYAGLLTLLAAVVAGVVPALKVTGRRMDARLRQASSAAGGLRFGLSWQGLIVAQIAATVVFAVGAWLIHRQAAELMPKPVGFDPGRFVVVPLEMDPEESPLATAAGGEGAAATGKGPGSAAPATDTDLASAAPATDTDRDAQTAFNLPVPFEIDSATRRDADRIRRYATIVQELERRLAGEPGVVAVTVAERFPLMDQPRGVVELDETGARAQAPRTTPPHWVPEVEHTRPGQFFVNTAVVAPGFFQAFDAPILSGRGFEAGDLGEGARAVVVNRSFVDRVLEGGSPIGRRIRYVVPPEETPGPWYEIVGVVDNLVLDRRSPLVLDREVRAHLYHPLSPGRPSAAEGSRPWRYPLYLAVVGRGDAASLAPTLRGIAAEVSPTLRLEIQTLDREMSEDARFMRFSARGILGVSMIALILSLAGIYSVMSFTVARRTREIGVRVALGGPSLRVVAEVFRSPMRLVVAGVAAGCALVGTMMALLVAGEGLAEGLLPVQGVVLVLAVGAATVAVCGLACIGPIRRALRVQPIVALSTEV